MNFSTPLPNLSLEERRALLWFRANQPVQIRLMTPGAPRPHIRQALLERKLIAFDPSRKRYDPIVYCLTPEGEKALKP
jgi:hypothetical protein